MFCCCCCVVVVVVVFVAFQNATKLGVLDKTGTRDFVSSATICGDLYIAAWDIYPSAFGIAGW